MQVCTYIWCMCMNRCPAPQHKWDRPSRCTGAQMRKFRSNSLLPDHPHCFGRTDKYSQRTLNYSPWCTELLHHTDNCTGRREHPIILVLSLKAHCYKRSSYVSHVLLTLTSLIYETELKTSIQRLFQIISRIKSHFPSILDTCTFSETTSSYFLSYFNSERQISGGSWVRSTS